MHAPDRRATIERTLATATAAAAVLLIATPALAHGGEHAEPEHWWRVWSFQTLPLIGITLATATYSLGLLRLWRRAGVGRGVRWWRAGGFYAGIVALVVALLSPMDTISGQLGSVHMVQHTVLMLVAAPLLVAGSPGAVAIWALPNAARRAVGELFTRWRLRDAARYVLWQPVALWIGFALVLWVWHLPALYDLALRNRLVHDAQHLAFLLAACLYWRVLLDPVGRVRLTPTLAIAYLFTTSLHGMLLGAFMAMSQRVWYPSYLGTTQAWGLTPLEDQQAAGAIMWMPACAVYAGVAAGILGVWLHRSAARDEPATGPPGIPGTPGSPGTPGPSTRADPVGYAAPR